MTDDVAKLICGNVDDLKCYLRNETNRDLIELALAAARAMREGKTKAQILERHLRKLSKS